MSCDDGCHDERDKTLILLQHISLIRDRTLPRATPAITHA